MRKFDSLFQWNKSIINISSYLINYLRFPVNIKMKEILKRNDRLKQNKSTERCFILGLGPSLSKIDISKIEDDIIVINRFNLMDNSSSISPKYYCLVDAAFFESHAIEDFKDALNKFPNTSFLVNGKYYDNIKTIISNKENIYYANMWKGLFSSDKKIDFQKTMPAIGNVLAVAIALAIYVGYKEIVLLGADYTLFVNKQYDHSYTDEKAKANQNISNEMFKYSFVTDVHHNLDEFAQKQDVEIINATVGSMLNVYKKDEKFSKLYKKKQTNFYL